MTKKIGLLLIILVVGLISCGDVKKNQPEVNAYSIPHGYEDFDGLIKRYNVFASCADSVHHFEIKALMTAYIDTIKNMLIPRTTFILKHSSGKSLIITTNHRLMDTEEFRKFVNSHSSIHNDTIVELVDTFDIIVKGDEYNLSELDMPFAFLDVSFKGYKSLLVRKETNSPCVFFDVYSIVSDSIHKVTFEPYNQFKTATNEWMLGYGTSINYKKKEIRIPSLKQGSCSDYGTFIYDCYVLDRYDSRFSKHQETVNYDFCE